MKTLLKFKYVIILCFVTFISCSKDTVQEDNKFNYGTVEAIVYDSFKTLNSLEPVHVDSQNYITVYGYNDEIGITLKLPNTIGVYQFENLGASAKLTLGDPFDFFDVNNDGPAIDYNAIEGSVQLTENNGTRVKGSFHFLGERYDGQRMAVSEGEFDVIIE